MIKAHPSAVVSKEAHLADGVVIGPNCVIDRDVSIGAGTVLDANVVISEERQDWAEQSLFPQLRDRGQAATAEPECR